MAKKNLSIEEVMEICGVDEEFVVILERKEVIHSTTYRGKKQFSLSQVDRVRVARVLTEEMRVNFEGVDVVLNMREQMIAMQRQFIKVLERLTEEVKKSPLDSE